MISFQACKLFRASIAVHLSVTLSPTKSLGEIQPNLLHHVPSWLDCARATLLSVRPSVRRPYICPSGYILIHWVKFNQTYYMTFPHGHRVGEQVRPSVMLLAILAKSVGICDGAPSTSHSSLEFAHVHPANFCKT